MVHSTILTSNAEGKHVENRACCKDANPELARKNREISLPKLAPAGSRQRVPTRWIAEVDIESTQ
eukprot:scaffold19481_cov112-Isochrysis_galbana.AAC.4